MKANKKAGSVGRRARREFTAEFKAEAVQGSVDGGDWNQPFSWPVGLGVEQHDSQYACWNGPYLQQCDHADFSYYSIGSVDYDPSTEQPYEVGLIWRLQTRDQGPYGIGSPNVDQSYPRLTVSGVQEYPVMGQVMDKVGEHTRWTWGTVYRTCASTSLQVPNGFKLHCQDYASYASEPGDSGGPVFVHYPNIAPSEGGNGIVFMGINWANDPGRGGVFGSVRQIRNEIGNFRFW